MSYNLVKIHSLRVTTLYLRFRGELLSHLNGIMSHPEFFWSLKCSYCLFKSGSAEGNCPLSGIGVRRDLANWTRNIFSPFAPPEAAQEKREMGHSPIPQARGISPCNPCKKMFEGLLKNSG